MAISTVPGTTHRLIHHLNCTWHNTEAGSSSHNVWYPSHAVQSVLNAGSDGMWACDAGKGCTGDVPLGAAPAADLQPLQQGACQRADSQVSAARCCWGVIQVRPASWAAAL